MGTKTVRIEDRTYERIKAHKRDDETLSEAIARLIDDYPLVEFAGGMSEEAATKARERLEDAHEEYVEELVEDIG